jgi:hypothetical protein
MSTWHAHPSSPQASVAESLNGWMGGWVDESVVGGRWSVVGEPVSR